MPLLKHYIKSAVPRSIESNTKVFPKRIAGQEKPAWFSQMFVGFYHRLEIYKVKGCSAECRQHKIC